MSSDPYVLDAGFEADVVGYCVTDRTFFGSVVKGLDASAFPSAEARLIVGLCIVYYQTNGSCPGNARIFSQVLRRHCCDEQKCTVSDMNRAAEYLVEALDHPAPMEAVLAEFSTMLQQRVRDDAARDLMMTSRGTEDYSKLALRLQEADMLGISDRSKGLGLTLRDEPPPEKQRKRCPTGVAVFDYISKGGNSPGTLFAYLADTGFGKSLGLAQMAAANIREGNNVLYHAAEMTDLECRYRIIADLVDIPYEDIENNLPGVRDRADEKLEYCKRRYGWGELCVKYTEPDDGTPEDTESFAEDFARDIGQWPDLIVIDYADRITWKGAKADSSDYIVQGKVWQAYDILAKRKGRECVVATASQAKELQKGQQWLNHKNMADSKRKARYLSVGASINWNSTRTEGGLHIFKGRKGLPVGRTLPIKPNWPYARISEISERVKQGMKPSQDRLKGDIGANLFIDQLVEVEPEGFGD